MDKQEDIDENLLANLEKFGSYHRDRYSTIWERFLAGLIDGVILGLIFIPIELAIPGDWYLGSPNHAFSILWSFKLVPYFYAMYFHGKYGKTIGKKLMGLKVIDKTETGEIGFKQAFLRDLIPVTGIVILFSFLMVIENSETKVDSIWIEHSISGISAAWFLIEVVTAALNKKRRAFHDYFAGTVVVKL